ncbi:MAG: S24/S26 family peptidase, partial [Phycicoccus sp.]
MDTTRSRVIRSAVAGSAVAVTVAVARWRLSLVTVTGRSMEPALRAGDQLLVRRCGTGAVRRGRVVLALPPPAADAVTLPEPVHRPAET